MHRFKSGARSVADVNEAEGDRLGPPMFSLGVERRRERLTDRPLIFHPQNDFYTLKPVWRFVRVQRTSDNSARERLGSGTRDPLSTESFQSSCARGGTLPPGTAQVRSNSGYSMFELAIGSPFYVTA